MKQTSLFHLFVNFTPGLDSFLTREKYFVLMAYSILGPSAVAVVTQSLQSGMNPDLLSAGKHSFSVKLNFRQSSSYIVGLWSGCLNTSYGIALGT